LDEAAARGLVHDCGPAFLVYGLENCRYPPEICRYILKFVDIRRKFVDIS